MCHDGSPLSLITLLDNLKFILAAVGEIVYVDLGKLEHRARHYACRLDFQRVIDCRKIHF
jgi:hypothetical protein